MAREGWERWVNKEDSSVVYEARQVEEGYEFRRPDSPWPLGTVSTETWEAIYERMEEES